MLKTLIKQHGYTIQSIADHLGRDRSSVTNSLKSGTLKYKEIISISEFMGISPCELFDEKLKKAANMTSEPQAKYQVGIVESQKETIRTQRELIDSLKTNIELLTKDKGS